MSRDEGPVTPELNAMKTKKRARTRRQKPQNHDDYLAGLSKEKRQALQKLRKTIRAAAPKAEECISYGIPAFRLNGRFLMAYGAGANHCAFYPGSALQNLGKELNHYDTSKGTIRFPAEKPLPASLVRKVVQLRIRQQLGQGSVLEFH
jgi:uncharacterized protein YdhG (YjbR/CyaY superfamily)